jgi:hypothetical protein
MIDELRTTLALRADLVTPAPDPYGRLLYLRARRRRRRTGVVAGLLALALVVSGWWVTRDVSPPPDLARPVLDGDPPALVAALLDSPTRGSLANDTGFVDAIRQRAAQEGGHATGVGGPRLLPADPARVRVLFAGDVPGAKRIAIVAGVTASSALTEYVSPEGMPVSALTALTSDTVHPVVTMDWGSAPDSEYTLVLAPAGTRLAFSADPHYLADGTIRRTWTDLAGDYLIRANNDQPPGARVRCTLNGTVLYESMLPSIKPPGGPATVDPAPLYGRGKPEPLAARAAATLLAQATGLRPPQATFEVLWSDDVPMPGLQGSKPAMVATVMAVTADGGGPYVTLALDPAAPDASMRSHPTGNGVLGDHAHGLIAMRLPFYSGTAPSEALEIIGPQAAVRAEVVRGTAVVASTALQSGVGQLTLFKLETGTEVTVRVFDGAGRVLTQRPFAEQEENVGIVFEPSQHAW